MSVNSTSSSCSLPCTYQKVSAYMFNAMITLKVLLLLPLSTFVLYLGHHQWRQQRSSKPATHSDIITYHVAAMAMIYVLGSFFYFGGAYTKNSPVMTTGLYTIAVPFSGEILFHLLTCVERYLAVVHPITYLGLRNARGVRIRNICISCVWLLSCGLTSLTPLSQQHFTPFPMFCVLVLSTIVISFCSLSVLCVLIRPGPGDRGGSKERVDQSKLRAFHTITVISATVWLWFFGLLIATAVNMSPLLSHSVTSLVMISIGWFNLPSSLVSPLLYLHRAGKLSCCWSCLHVADN